MYIVYMCIYCIYIHNTYINQPYTIYTFSFTIIGNVGSEEELQFINSMSTSCVMVALYFDSYSGLWDMVFSHVNLSLSTNLEDFYNIALCFRSEQFFGCLTSFSPVNFIDNGTDPIQ